jgi:hypothetical protein
VARWPGILAMEPVLLGAGSDSGSDGFTDLVLATTDSAGEVREAELRGAPGGDMSDPFSIYLAGRALPISATIPVELVPSTREIGGSIVVFDGDAMDPAAYLLRLTPDLQVGPGDGTGIAHLTALLDPSCALFAAGDLDGDGSAEVIAVDGREGCAGSPRGLVLRSVPAPAGTGLQPWSLEPGGGAPRELLAGDLTGDGLADAVLVSSTGVSVLAGSRDLFLDRSRTTLPELQHLDGAGGATSAALLDADGDGHSDLALAMPDGTIVLTGPGRTASVAWTAAASEGPAMRLLPMDLDEDGVTDLLAGDATNLRILLAHARVAP